MCPRPITANRDSPLAPGQRPVVVELHLNTILTAAVKLRMAVVLKKISGHKYTAGAI